MKSTENTLNTLRSLMNNKQVTIKKIDLAKGTAVALYNTKGSKNVAAKSKRHVIDFQQVATNANSMAKKRNLTSPIAFDTQLDSMFSPALTEMKAAKSSKATPSKGKRAEKGTVIKTKAKTKRASGVKMNKATETNKKTAKPVKGTKGRQTKAQKPKAKRISAKQKSSSAALH